MKNRTLRRVLSYSSGASCGVLPRLFALRAATQKAALEGDQIAEKSIVERFFALARTHFSTKS